MEDYLPQIKKFEVRPDDTWICTFPKCGTTWTQEMVWCLKNKLDFAKAKSTSQNVRVPFLEMSGLMPRAPPNSIGNVNDMESPRIIKTHLALGMLPQGFLEKASKIIYVVRNPRDTCVSLYHHWKLLHTYTGSFEDFADLFLNDLCGHYAPFFPHVLKYWENRSSPNMLFITYEEMKKNLRAVIRRTASFLEVEVTEEDVLALEKHLSFDSMKRNDAVNKTDLTVALHQIYKEAYNCTPPQGDFMRKGKVGDWKEYITGDLLDRFVHWEKHGLSDCDIQFDFE